jgi:hypothetical protein
LVALGAAKVHGAETVVLGLQKKCGWAHPSSFGGLAEAQAEAHVSNRLYAEG